MREPTIRTEMFGRDRYVTVTFELNEKTSEHVSAWFIDPENPEEAPEAERERLMARARDLLRKTAGPRPRKTA
jgi:hypothetical protein